MVQDRAEFTIDVELGNGAVESASWFGIKAVGGLFAAHALDAPFLLALQATTDRRSCVCSATGAHVVARIFGYPVLQMKYSMRQHPVSFIAHLR